MQYGIEVYPYQRIGKVKEKKRSRNNEVWHHIFRLAICFGISFFIGRVVFIKVMAPFGIAFLLAVCRCDKREDTILSSGIGTIIGYISVNSDINNLGMYILLIGTIVFSEYILKKVKMIRKFAALYLITFILCILYSAFISGNNLGHSILLSCGEIVCIFPIYYIMQYSILCLRKSRTKHLYTNEEVISIIVISSLIIAGVRNINILNISVRNIIALLITIVIGFAGGSMAGTSFGVVLGLIIGMSGKNVTYYISVYSLCGLTSGIFARMKKWTSGAAYMIAYLMLTAYSNNMNKEAFIEAAISLLIFYAIPQKAYGILSLNFNSEKEEENKSQCYMSKIKMIVTGKLKDFSDVLVQLSDILRNLADNNKLQMGKKSSALVECLADRTCSNCSLINTCWKKDSHYTYSAFEEAIQNCIDNKNVVPLKIEERCIKKSLTLENAKHITDNFIQNEMFHKKLSEGRELIAAQIKNMASSVNDIINELNNSIKMNMELEKRISKVFERNKIEYKNLLCFVDKNERDIVRLNYKNCNKNQECIKSILPLINEASGKNMCVMNDECIIDKASNECLLAYEEMNKFYVSTYCEKLSKDEEECSGDSYCYKKLDDGTYMMAISDGMGSGAEAEKESSAVIELIEKLMSSGFKKLTAINMANSIMTMKFTEDEKFTTVDLSCIDLYTGDVEFFKVGSASSFIKRGSDVQCINSKTLPIGVLDKPDIDIIRNKVKNGDVIIMVSDGITDCKIENKEDEEWISEFISHIETENPKEIAADIINKAKEISNGRIKDDMTVIVSKVYSLY